MTAIYVIELRPSLNVVWRQFISIKVDCEPGDTLINYQLVFNNFRDQDADSTVRSQIQSFRRRLAAASTVLTMSSNYNTSLYDSDDRKGSTSMRTRALDSPNNPFSGLRVEPRYDIDSVGHQQQVEAIRDFRKTPTYQKGPCPSM